MTTIEIATNKALAAYSESRANRTADVLRRLDSLGYRITFDGAWMLAINDKPFHLDMIDRTPFNTILNLVNC